MSGMIWSLGLSAFALIVGFWFARQSGRDQALRERSEKEKANASKAAEVIAEHRTVDDTTKRLQNGDF